MAKTYEQLVEEGRQIVADGDMAISKRNWDAGDRALEVESLPLGAGPRGDDGNFIEGSKLKKYAKDIGAHYKSLGDWRATSDAWGVAERSATVSWAAHRVLNAQPDRIDLIRQGKVRTYEQARQIIRDRDKPDDKPDTLPSTFSDRLIYALGRMNGETTPFENLIRSNDGRKLQARHLETIQRSAAIARASADLLEAIGRGDYEAIEAQAWMDVLYRPWTEGEIKS